MFKKAAAQFTSAVYFFDQGSLKKKVRGPDLVQKADQIGPAILRVQTVPLKLGVLKFKVQYRKPEVESFFKTFH